MKITTNTLTRMIHESIKRHLTKINEDSLYLPAGAEYASNAPWNEPSNEYENDEIEEVFPTIPFILEMVTETVTNEQDILNTIKQGLIDAPEEVAVCGSFSYCTTWDAPDEDGYSCENRENEELEELDIYLKTNGKYVQLIKWIQETFGNKNPKIVQVLSEAYDAFIDYFKSEASTAYDLEKLLHDIKTDITRIK